MTSRHHITERIKGTKLALDKITPDSITRMFDRMADARHGYPTGHDPTGHQPTRGHEPDCDCDNCTPPPAYSDRTGELATGGRDPVEADMEALNQATRDIYSASATIAAIHRRYGLVAPVVQWCASCKRDGGWLELVAAGRYADACRWCGDSRSRNGGEWPPVAILRAHHLRQPITDQLIAANPLRNTKRWKRSKRRDA